MNKRQESVSTRKLILIWILILAPFSNTAIAAGIEGLCASSSGLSTGQWAEYESDAPFMKNKVKGRYAVVGAETGQYWLEIESASPTGQGSMIIKILIPGWPYTTEEVTRAQMQLPRIEGMDPLPPMEIPPKSVQSGNVSDPLRMACEVIEEGVVESTQESVTVAAGTLTATRIPVRQLGKDVWVSIAVPFGIVKMVDEDGLGLELTAYGNDALPAITESAQTFPGEPEQ